MANQRVFTISISQPPGTAIWILYNDANLRIGNVEWSIPASGVAVRIRIWDSNVSVIDPVIDRTEGGPGSGSETIAGSYRLVEFNDEILGPVLQLPANLRYEISSRSL